MVRPTGQPLIPAVAAWASSELDHASRFWRGQFRGEAIVRNDSDITQADITNSNLVLWAIPATIPFSKGSSPNYR